MPEHSDQAVIDQLAHLFDRLDAFAPPIRLDDVLTEAAPRALAHRSTASIRTFRRRRWAVSVAASMLVAAGAFGVWWTVGRDTRPSTPTSFTDSTAVDDAISGSTNQSHSTPGPPATASSSVDEASPAPPGSIVDQVAVLDSWSAARRFQIDAQYGASPAQAADIIVANELASRACYEAQGVEIPPFDPERIYTLAQHEEQRWDLRRLHWTPAGQDRLRREGNVVHRVWLAEEPDMYPHATTPAPVRCYPAATGVTHLGGPVVWSEDQLLETLQSGSATWQPASWSFGRLPGTIDAAVASDECMVGRGWDEWTAPAAYSSLYTQPEVSGTEIGLMNDLVDCLNSVAAPAVYLTASADYVSQFRAEFAQQLDQIETERADALTKAYDILRAAGLDPLSD